MATPEEIEAIEREIQRFKLKKLIQNLDSARGNGTSMITLMLTPKDTIPRMVQLLTDEQGTATNIKNHVNKVSVLAAITSVMQRLKLFTRVPPNGLVIYSGTIITEDNKEKKVTIDMEPFKPVARTMYMCDSRFHTAPLASMLESDDKFGFIIMDGSGTLFGILQGSTRDVLHKLTVELPKKHGRGGQSALRFARLRMEKRHNYLRKVAELTTQLFITNDRPNVAGLVLAGSADFKSDLCQSDLFDLRLQPIVLKVVDVAYGGENGFNQAVELAGDVLAGVRFVQEKKLITRFFNEISTDTSRYVFGVDDTWRALEMGAVQTLIIWEALPHLRVTVAAPGGSGEPTVYLVPNAEAIDQKKLVDPASGAPLEVEKEPFVEWLASNYRKYGCTLEFVTNKSHEGNQFCRGFGGIGGLLRYQVDFAQLRRAEEAAEAAAHAGAAGEEGGAGAGAAQKPVDQFCDDDFI